MEIHPIKIKLSQGQETIIDSDDLDKIKGYRWYANYNPTTKSYYAVTSLIINKKKKSIYLSNLIKDHIPTSKLTVDHIDGNSLNNRKSNLRIVNKTIQSINRKKQETNTSGTKGVYESKSLNRWFAIWFVNKKEKSKSFSVKKYGYEEAKKLAIEYRLKMENEVNTYREALCFDKNNAPISKDSNYKLDDLEKYNYQQTYKKLSSLNSTGVSGVSHYLKSRQCVSGWYENGKLKRKCFPYGHGKKYETYEIALQEAADYLKTIKQ